LRHIGPFWFSDAKRRRHAATACATRPRTNRQLDQRSSALPVQAKVSLARTGPGPCRIAGQPGIKTYPVLTTAPSRPEPLKLLPFGGARTMLLRERVGLHHMMPGMTTCEGQRVCPGLPLQFIIISIAYIHFTRLQGFSDNPAARRGCRATDAPVWFPGGSCAGGAGE